MSQPSQQSLVLGVDPGLTGYMAFLRLDGSVERLARIPTTTVTVHKSRGKGSVGQRRVYDLPGLVAVVGPLAPSIALAAVEKLQTTPGVSGQTSFSMGYSEGMWSALCEALGVSLTLVRPQAWQRDILGEVPKGESKVRSIVAARHRWPDTSLRPTPRSRKDSSDMADSLHIARWALGRWEQDQ